MRQPDLLSVAAVVGFDASFAGVRRSELAHGAWVEHVPGWLRGHDALFDELCAGLAWRSESRVMYERVVATPRLLARVPKEGPGQPLIEEMRLALSARYGEDFVRTTAALYRDGRDSVAFHGDTPRATWTPRSSPRCRSVSRGAS